jgi:hypothetical protein
MDSVDQKIVCLGQGILLDRGPESHPNLDSIHHAGRDEGGDHLGEEVEVNAEEEVLEVDVQVVDHKSILGELKVFEIRFEDSAEGRNETVDVIVIFVEMTTGGRGRGQGAGGEGTETYSSHCQEGRASRGIEWCPRSCYQVACVPR